MALRLFSAIGGFSDEEKKVKVQNVIKEGNLIHVDFGEISPARGFLVHKLGDRDGKMTLIKRVPKGVFQFEVTEKGHYAVCPVDSARKTGKHFFFEV